MYFALSDLPQFDIDTDSASELFFNNSRLFITSSGKILDERNNFLIFYIVNSGDDDIDLNFTMMQNARYLAAVSLSIFIALIAYVF